MPRFVAFLIFACWIASVSGIAAAQPVAPPPCKRGEAEAVVAAGGVPTFVNCSLEEIDDLVNPIRQRFRVFFEPDNETSGVKQGIISRQVQQDGQVTYFVATGAGYPPEEVQRPRFSISAPASVKEGDQLTLTIRREGSDGRPHRVRVTYDHPELVDAKEASIDFSTDRTEEIIPVDTATGQPGDGDRSIMITLETGEDAVVAEPGSATVTILDTPPTNYLIERPQNVNRGDPMEFVVRRTGPPSESAVEYQLSQPSGIGDTQWLPLTFDEQGMATVPLSSEAYLPCGNPPLLKVRASQNGIIQAAASFSSLWPPACEVEPPENGIPDWWPIPAGILGTVAVAYLISKIWPPPVPPALYPTWEVEAAPAAGPFNAPRIPGWPRFSAQVDLEWGGASVPEPLPIAETNDG
jgi:hypothetical protein